MRAVPTAMELLAPPTAAMPGLHGPLLPWTEREEGDLEAAVPGEKEEGELEATVNGERDEGELEAAVPVMEGPPPCHPAGLLPHRGHAARRPPLRPPCASSLAPPRFPHPPRRRRGSGRAP